MLLSWNDLLLWQLRLPAAAKAAARVVTSQLSVLDSLVAERKWPRITQRAGAVLRAKPALLDEYVGAARAGDTAACSADIPAEIVKAPLGFSTSID